MIFDSVFYLRQLYAYVITNSSKVNYEESQLNAE